MAARGSSADVSAEEEIVVSRRRLQGQVLVLERAVSSYELAVLRPLACELRRRLPSPPSLGTPCAIRWC